LFSLGHLWGYLTTAFRAIWLQVPGTLRIAAYRRLAFLGERLYGPSCSLRVQRLPFGLYLKARTAAERGGLENEFEAMQLARRHTDVVVPRPLDLVSDAERSYLLSSALPGRHIGLCIDTMSDEEVEVFVQDLRKWLMQIRSIPKAIAPEYKLSSAVGKGCHDYRISAGVAYDKARGDFFGPFRNEKDFNDVLRCGALPEVVHRDGHQIVFTHGDLNMRNIMVRDGKLSGIVDWENAGWFPEHWDYNKAHFITKHHWRWKRIVDRVFEDIGDYQGELAIEKMLWEYCF